MARFFIDRPVFAWVIAIFIALAGVLSITQLPIAQYPTVAPPSVVVRATYPGASAEILDESVTSLIEQALNGAEGLTYMESQSQSRGAAQVTAYFRPGTDPDMAAVEVQNRIAAVEARLPGPVQQLGLSVRKANSGFLMIVSLVSPDGSVDAVGLGDFLNRNVVDEIRRVEGVGDATVFGTERAMRVWLDPEKLVGFSMTPSDVLAAVRQQNAVVSAGSFGELPAGGSQQIFGTIVVSGQLATPEEFEQIVLRAHPDGSVVRLGDVARVELGAQNYTFTSRTNGRPSTAMGVQLSPTGNAVATAKAVRERMEELSRFFPEGIDYAIPFDTSNFVVISIEAVIHTLLEAIVLVFLVMYLFLQNLRATIIPTIVVPVALMGAFAMMWAFGFSINVLTMFGMVLAIGILVDDAIVVVENVERIMAEEGLGPREATRKAMSQITGAIVGITLVLAGVFLPMALFGGAVGVIYRQFSLSMVSSIAFSGFLALTLTPALCATLLKPGAHGHDHDSEPRPGPAGWFDRLFGGFNRFFERVVERYGEQVGAVLKRTGRAMAVYGVLLGVLGVAWANLPTSFLPSEDQGSVTTNVQLPAGASANRTDAVLAEIESWFLSQPEVDGLNLVRGFSFSGAGQNAGIAFVSLRDWSERERDADTLASESTAAFSRIRDAIAFTMNPPPIRELGNSSGFSFRLQDRGGLGHDALVAARDDLVRRASESPVLTGVRVDELDDAPQLEIVIDRVKASALGVPYTEIASTLQVALGSSYANDFPNAGRQQQVIVQADVVHRMQPDDLDRLHVRNVRGEMVPLSSVASTRWVMGPVQLTRYNGYPAMRISGNAAPGYTTGQAMAEMERLAAGLPDGFGYEWTGQSLEEKTSGSQAPALLGLSFLFVFLCLAALYESWSIPTAVMLVVPLGVLGAVVATTMRGLPDDVYFKVGLVTIIGLSAKNAILIVEFAKDLHAQGKDLVEATIEACRLRFRPIVMTSLAFTLGVVPLVTASGASSASQRAIGTAVMGGMIAATVLAVYLVPVFFVVVKRAFPGAREDEAPALAVVEEADHA